MRVSDRIFLFLSCGTSLEYPIFLAEFSHDFEGGKCTKTLISIKAMPRTVDEKL